jgi:hypothetical protein
VPVVVASRRTLRALLLGALSGVAGCKAPPPGPTLLDREFEAYRLDRDERSVEDLKSREAAARAEAERLERELAGYLRRIREAKAELPDARAEAERLAAPPVAPSPVPAAPAPAPLAPAAPAPPPVAPK